LKNNDELKKALDSKVNELQTKNNEIKFLLDEFQQLENKNKLLSKENNHLLQNDQTQKFKIKELV
jgi:hypothetical protein